MSEIIRAWLLQPILAKLKDVFDALGVVSDESKALLVEVAALKAALKTAGQTSPEVDAALAAVVARTNSIDALVPNALPSA